jgi:hypothetical protein
MSNEQDAPAHARHKSHSARRGKGAGRAPA